jgi:hypothetical protein
MQKIPIIRVVFVIITENISFIPDNITNCCRIIRIARPTRELYNKCLANAVAPAANTGAPIANAVGNDIELEKITNMKNMIGSITQLMNPHETICKKLFKMCETSYMIYLFIIWM